MYFEWSESLYCWWKYWTWIFFLLGGTFKLQIIIIHKMLSWEHVCFLSTVIYHLVNEVVGWCLLCWQVLKIRFLDNWQRLTLTSFWNKSFNTSVSQMMKLIIEYVMTIKWLFPIGYLLKFVNVSGNYRGVLMLTFNFSSLKPLARSC